MDIETAANCLCELGNPHRLEAFRLLVRAGHEGLSVGAIQQHLNIPKSTLSHHISHLVFADLVRQRREGRTLICVANFELAETLVAFLGEQCCEGVSEVPSQEAV